MGEDGRAAPLPYRWRPVGHLIVEAPGADMCVRIRAAGAPDGDVATVVFSPGSVEGHRVDLVVTDSREYRVVEGTPGYSWPEPPVTPDGWDPVATVRVRRASRVVLKQDVEMVRLPAGRAWAAPGGTAVPTSLEVDLPGGYRYAGWVGFLGGMMLERVPDEQLREPDLLSDDLSRSMLQQLLFRVVWRQPERLGVLEDVMGVGAARRADDWLAARPKPPRFVLVLDSYDRSPGRVSRLVLHEVAVERTGRVGLSLRRRVDEESVLRAYRGGVDCSAGRIYLADRPSTKRAAEGV